MRKRVYNFVLLFVFSFFTLVNAQTVKILLFGDSQKIVNEAPASFLSNMDKLLTDNNTKDADFILQMGDLTEDALASNWDNAQLGWKKLDGKIPYVLNVGNNDLYNDANANQYNEHFPISKYNLLSSFVSNYDRNTNVAHRFSAGGANWLVISIKFEGMNSSNIKSWAQNLISSNSNDNVIIINHDAVGTTSAAVTMGKAYKNVVLVVGGHHNPSQHGIVTGINGNKVGWTRVCQHSKSQDSYACVIKMDLTAKTMNCRYYSAQYGKYWDDPSAPEYSSSNRPQDAPWSWSGFNFVLNGPNNAEFVSQSGIPTTLTPGQKATVSVTMKNAGTSTWTKTDLFKLGSQNPQDNNLLCPNRIDLNTGESIAPNENKTFTFEIIAPPTSGTYNFQWKMIQEGVDWFGKETTNMVINPVPVSGITIMPATVNINVNNTYQLTANVTPADAYNKAIYWSISNAVVATVDANGLVKGLTPGTATITATSQDGNKTITSAIAVYATWFTYLDDCDALTGWNSSSILNSVDSKQGASCIEFNGSATEEFKKVFSTPYYSGATTTDCKLAFWYYVSDITKCGNVYVEIASSGVSDVNEYQWTILASGLRNGWNIMNLKPSSATVIGTPNLNAINWFRIYGTKTGSITTRIDAIQLGNNSQITGVEDVLFKNNINNKSVNIYPNPLNQHLLSMDVTGFEDQYNVNIRIINLTGQTVYQKFENRPCHLEIETSGLLSKSVYFVSVEGGESIVTKKLIVQ